LGLGQSPVGRLGRPLSLGSLLPAIALYASWLSEQPDPRELMVPFPAAPMRMWPISIRVNKPENDDPAILEPIELVSPAA